MSRKVPRVNPNFRPNKLRKRKYQGNQFNALDAESSDDEARETPERGVETGTSASARKIKATAADVIINFAHCYRIIEFLSVFSAISDISVCQKCKQKQTFGEVDNRGLGFKISVKCLCGTVLINSGPFVKNGYEINRRIVFVMRLLGVAREGINLFCGMMELGFGLSQNAYEGVVKHMHDSTEKMFKYTCKKAVDEEKSHNEKNERPLLNLKVSGDGSWKKRGYSSLYGVTTLIGYYTGKVVDLIVKGSYCQTCTYYKNDQNNINYLLHKDEENCAVNHTGSSGKMEVDSVKEMFLRSEELYGVRYSTYVGDGDAKTFKALLDVEPYGEDFKIQKSECVGHVEKRMGTRLRNVKKTAKIGGKGKLTDVLIKKLTKYYGLAIYRNCGSVEDMKKAIMATFYHLSSTNENPRHHNCPPGADSWCKWQVAQTLGENFEHPPPLHSEVQKHIFPIYKDLSRDDLLERCLGGHSQNANESFNATIWRLVPKHLHCGIKILETSAYVAAGMFNDGYKFVLQCMQDMEIIIGQQSNMFANTYDHRRINRQERRSFESTKKARSARKMEKTALLDDFQEEEGLLYGPGIAD